MKMLRMSEADYLKKKKAGKPDPPPLPTEHQEQAGFFTWWWDYAAFHRLHPKLCFCIPNASALSAAGRIYKWAEGLTAGVYDTFLSIPRGQYHGLYIEFKRKGGKGVSDAQKEFGEAVAYWHYKHAVHYTARDAIREAEDYLKL